jgi:hypothetical protein
MLSSRFPFPFRKATLRKRELAEHEHRHANRRDAVKRMHRLRHITCEAAREVMGAKAVPACKTRTHLRRSCSIAFSDHTRAGRVLRERSGQMSARNHELLQSYVAQTRKLAEQARSTLNKHLVEHGCGAQKDVFGIGNHKYAHVPGNRIIDLTAESSPR